VKKVAPGVVKGALLGTAENSALKVAEEARDRVVSELLESGASEEKVRRTKEAVRTLTYEVAKRKISDSLSNCEGAEGAATESAVEAAKRVVVMRI
jgi:anti-sigma28 factor (negative regulator of flagellin synthesis)